MYETMLTRHTCMVVGPTGGGKSVVINTLARSQTRYSISILDSFFQWATLEGVWHPHAVKHQSFICQITEPSNNLSCRLHCLHSCMEKLYIQAISLEIYVCLDQHTPVCVFVWCEHSRTDLSNVSFCQNNSLHSFTEKRNYSCVYMCLLHVAGWV